MEEPLLIEDDEELLILESVIDHEVTITQKGNQYHCYFVKYKNHSLEEYQWLPTTSLSPTYQHLIFVYHTHTRPNNE